MRVTKSQEDVVWEDVRDFSDQLQNEVKWNQEN